MTRTIPDHLRPAFWEFVAEVNIKRGVKNATNGTSLAQVRRKCQR
jgi:hypothetical protein